MASAKQIAKKYDVSVKTAKKMKQNAKANGVSVKEWNSYRVAGNQLHMSTQDVFNMNIKARQAGMGFNEYQRNQYAQAEQDRLNQIEMDYNSSEAKKSRDFNSAEAQKTRDFNSQEAQIARDWEERMSNTAHQREVADLKLAGLNPVLSANGGAMSYTTSSANASNASGAQASASIDSDLSAIASNAQTYFGWKEAKLANKTNLQIARMNKQVGLAQANASMANAGAMVSAASLQAGATQFAANMNYKSTKYKTDYGNPVGLGTKIGRWLGSHFQVTGKGVNKKISYKGK